MRNKKINNDANKCIKTTILRLLFLIWLFLRVNSTSADIYISEVLYDPLITESGGEAVELYNSGNDAVNISGYTIKTASSNNDATLQENAIIPAGGYYLIADSNWLEKKDDALYPSADHEEAITMTNTAAGVALIDKNNNTIDKVGWGAISDSELFSISPANISKNGESLIRILFSGDNSIDFISSQPKLENSRGEKESVNANAININVNVNDIGEYIQNISVDYDIDDKIFLLPGNQREIDVSFLVKKELMPDEVYLIFNESSYESSIISSSGLYEMYESKITVDYFQSPGDYTLSVFYRKSNYSTTKNISLEILPLLAFEIDLNSINCNVSHNRTCLIEGDEDISTKNKPTIRNIGNKALDFRVYASNLSNEVSSIDIGNIKFSFDMGQPDIELSNSPTLYDTGLMPGMNSLLPISLLIGIPEDISAGEYKTRLTLIGVSDE